MRPIHELICENVDVRFRKWQNRRYKTEEEKTGFRTMS